MTIDSCRIWVISPLSTTATVPQALPSLWSTRHGRWSRRRGTGTIGIAFSLGDGQGASQGAIRTHSHGHDVSGLLVSLLQMVLLARKLAAPEGTEI
jgi:hypothetical protein